MLVAFSVENFASFKGRATLSMVAAALTSRPAELDSTNVFEVREDLRLLASAAIYGANASGKSNLVEALRFMRALVLGSSRETVLREPIGASPFLLSTETERAPSRLEVVFAQRGVVYRYGFLVSRERVEEEWLFAAAGKREGYLFERSGEQIDVNRRTFREGLRLQQRTRPNALFLSVAAHWNGALAGQIAEWFERLSIDAGIDDRGAQRQLLARYAEGQLPGDVVDFIRALDLGVEGMQMDRGADQEYLARGPDGTAEVRRIAGTGQVSVRTLHTKYDSSGEPAGVALFDLMAHESQGTRRLFALAEAILGALRSGGVLVVDEVDARLHPALVAELFRIFGTPELNPRRAQLVAVTHDANLLGSGLLRRDQVWFVEKSRRGESTLTSLAEYRVRNDVAYEKHYLAGRYGAVPHIGPLPTPRGPDGEPARIREAGGAQLYDCGPPAAESRDEG